MKKDMLLNRLTHFTKFILVLVLLTPIAIIHKNNIGIFSENNSEKEELLSSLARDTVHEGAFYDSNGVMLTQPSTNKGEDAPLINSDSFSYLIGFNSAVYGRYGLRGSMEDYLYNHNNRNEVGDSVYLTVDTGLQNFAYEQILNDQEGSVVVIDNDTGAILTLASHSTLEFDANDLRSFMENSQSNEGSQLRRGTFENDPPGSTFKIVTAIAALEKQQDKLLTEQDFLYYDSGEYTPVGSTYKITNWAFNSYGQIGLNQAMKKSVNTYFSQLGIKVGSKYLTKVAENFLIGEEITIPFLTTIKSKFDLGDYSPFMIAQTSFGQGKTEITPLHIALIGQSLGNDGQMLNPYIVQSIKNDKRVEYTHEITKLSDVTNTEIVKKINEVLHETALEYGLDEETYGVVCAKTGSAELHDGTIHTYFLGYTPKVSFVISMNHGRSSADLYPKAKALLSYLLQLDNKIN